MAWQNTGNADASTLTVDKKAGNGISLPSYPKDYSLLNAFNTYPAINATAWSQLSDTDRNARLSAFKTYVNGLENINVDAIATNTQTKVDTVSCPLGNNN